MNINDIKDEHLTCFTKEEIKEIKKVYDKKDFSNLIYTEKLDKVTIEVVAREGNDERILILCVHNTLGTIEINNYFVIKSFSKRIIQNITATFTKYLRSEQSSTFLNSLSNLNT